MCMLLCVFVQLFLYSFAFTICPRVLPVLFFFFLVYFLLLLIIGGFVFWFGCSLLSFFFYYYFLIFKIFNNLKIFYFNTFILFYLFSFFLSFFLPFLLSRVADRVLVLWPGVMPVPLRWESRVQDISPPETSQLHVISNGKSSPRNLHLNAKTQLH